MRLLNVSGAKAGGYVDGQGLINTMICFSDVFCIVMQTLTSELLHSTAPLTGFKGSLIGSICHGSDVLPVLNRILLR